MKCSGKFVKLFAILVIALGALSFGLAESNDPVNPRQAQFTAETRGFQSGQLMPREVWEVSDNHISNPMHRVFQIIFILFVISPPLIVVLLFLIWCELRKRNEHK
jgi:hypothetical protein